MRIYRSQVPHIASEIIEVLRREGDIDVTDETIEEARKDLIAVMEEHLRREYELVSKVRAAAAKGKGSAASGQRGALPERGLPRRKCRRRSVSAALS